MITIAVTLLEPVFVKKIV